MAKSHKVHGEDVEFLNFSTGTVEKIDDQGKKTKEVVGLLTLRLQLGKFAPTTLLLPEEAAIRLRDQLSTQLPRTEFPSEYWNG